MTKVRVSILGGRWADQKSLRTLVQVCAAGERIGQRIASFLPSYLTPWVHPNALLPLGRQRGKFPDAAVGDLASTKRRNGFRAVMLISQQEVWDERAAAQEIQCDTHFSNDCWHIVRLYHRCRRLAGTESPAESWFSALKLLYDPRHGPGIGSLAERLQLRVAGLRGNGADDEVVQQIASHVAAMDPRNSRTLETFETAALVFFRVKWLQPVMKGTSCVRRLRLRSFGSFYVFCNNGCSCVRSSMRFLKLWLQIALEWLHECCMGFVLGRKPEHKTLCFSV